jgi:DHA2 family multidrug resistance protein
MFVIGLVMLASTALLPPFLQNLAGYSVTDTGLLLAPRGVGTMFAMMFAGRLALKFDPRYLMTLGTLLLLWSMWEMSGWTPDISATQLVMVTFVQGIGMGFVFIPMNLVAFATLPSHFRTDASALINLMRNVGSAIGISLTTTILASSTQILHAQMSERINPFNRALGVNAPSMMLNPMLPSGAQAADQLVNYNAQVAAYANDFIFMFFCSLPALVVIFLMKRPTMLPSTQKIELEVME